MYEQRGLLTPARNPAGWRSYGPNEMALGAEIVALRALGLNLAQVARVIEGDAQSLEPALAAHQTALEGRALQLANTIANIRHLRAGLVRGQAPTIGELTHLLESSVEPSIEFELPWPWGGELFKLPDIRPLNYIVGPLGSGKTRLALRLSEILPGAKFVGLDRLKNSHATTRVEGNPAVRRRVDHALGWLMEDGATESEALIALMVGMEEDGPTIFIVDMVEQGLDQATQQSVIALLRHRGANGRPLFLLTRSCVILDLTAVGTNESIILCPANHSPPTAVAPHPGAPGYEAVATCLASPEVRARTEGVVAWRPEKA